MKTKIAKAGLTKVFADETVYFKGPSLCLSARNCMPLNCSRVVSCIRKHSTESYPKRDLHTMYVGKIEKVLVRDDEYVGMDAPL